jgi:hypothetical protein
MQVLAGIIGILFILGLYKAIVWVHDKLMEKAKAELTDFKHRKNGKENRKEKS